MPLVLLQYKQGRELKELAERLAKALPEIVAPHLNVDGRERHDGGVTPDEIIVRCTESTSADVNVGDLEIVVFAHDFPERKANLEERKDGVIKDVYRFLADYDRNPTGFVWIILAPTAFGSLQDEPDRKIPRIDCEKARRLWNTIGNGTDLAPESMAQLREHVLSCPGCRPAYLQFKGSGYVACYNSMHKHGSFEEALDCMMTS